MTPDTRGDTTTGDTDTSPITFADTTGTTVVADETASGTDSTGAGATGATGSTGSTGPADSTTSDDTTTGEQAVPGQTINQLVSAGERTSSPNYTLVYTFGQPSSLQSTHQSTNYRIHGGLIGANGSPP